MHGWRYAAIGAFAIGFVTVTAQAAVADPVEDFYRGKQIRAIVGLDAGSDYDLWMRVITRHWGQYIPGHPSFVVENMPGAGQIVATNYIANIADKDGTVISTTERNLPYQLLLGDQNIRFDPQKLNWIGSPENTNRVCAAMAGVPVQKAADLFDHELVVGGGGSGSSISNTPLLLDKLLGMKFKLVEGYNTSQNIVLAMERGELQGLCQTLAGLQSTRPGWIEQGKFKILFSLEREPVPGLGAPTIYDFTRNDEQREIIGLYDSNLELGRPLVAPPGVPQERIAALRRAFDAMTEDADFRADAAKLGYTVTLRRGEELQRSVANLMATPKAIIEKTLAFTH
jgi:tripartite-type tricarboxylate transporter receptor subunit TctC